MNEATTEGITKMSSRHKAQRKVKLVCSALFYTASCPVPPGIRARDIGFMVEGLADEHSPLPLEQTAWGFLLDNRSSRSSHIFYYAAARELVFKNSSEATDLNWAAILPHFVATVGLKFEHATWLFLQEPECLTAICFESGSSAPARVYARFFPTESPSIEDVFALRRSILDKIPIAENHEVLPGVFRSDAPFVTRRGSIRFQLQVRVTEESDWVDWKRTEFKKPTRLQAADIRDHRVLSSHTEKRGTGKKLVYTIAALAACVAVLIGFEIQEARRISETDQLTALAEEQEPDVRRLKDIETMTKSLRQLFEKDFIPYQWLMALNTQRPEAVHFNSYAFDDQGAITAIGQVPEVKALNTYVEALKKNPKFSEVDLASLTTDKDGANFTLKAKTGDISAILELPPEPEPPASDESSSEEVSAEHPEQAAETETAETVPQETEPATDSEEVSS